MSANETVSPALPAATAPPLVSIIINNYNYERFVAKCIESACRQDYVSLEVIVVDDGSVDNSLAAIASVSGQFRLIRKQNGGQASAVNTGLVNSRGEIVIFLDSDDLLYPNCASRVVAAWRREITRIHYNLDVIDARGELSGTRYFTQDLPRGNLRDQVLRDGIVKSAPMSGNAYSRSFLDLVTPIPEASWRLGADAYLFNLATIYGETGAIDSPLGAYRRHGGNSTATFKNGKVNRKYLSVRLERERQTDALLTEHFGQLGVRYVPGTLQRSLAHLQISYLELLLDDRRSEKDGPLLRKFYWRYVAALWTSGLPLHKSVVIFAWSAVAACLPSKPREWLIEEGFRSGFVVGVGKSSARAR